MHAWKADIRVICKTWVNEQPVSMALNRGSETLTNNGCKSKLMVMNRIGRDQGPQPVDN